MFVEMKLHHKIILFC